MKSSFSLIKKLYSYLPFSVKQKLHSDFIMHKDERLKKVLSRRDIY
jgi:hypothetical protein